MNDYYKGSVAAESHRDSGVPAVPVSQHHNVPRGWSAADMPRLDGQVAVVTGANGGIGAATSAGLAAAGAHVIMACRSTDKGRHTRDILLQHHPTASFEVCPLDLADRRSIARFADDVLARHDRLDLLINNAGVMAVLVRDTVDGYESQMAINHLGHFALTGRLLPALVRAPAARVVTISSFVHHLGRDPVAHIGPAVVRSGLTGWRDRWANYAASKLANLAFCLELDRRARARNLPLVSCAAHPGYADTGLQTGRVDDGALSRVVLWLGSRTIAQSPHAGALPALYAASAPSVRGGDFYGPGFLVPLWGPPARARINPRAHDITLREQLWRASIEATGVSLWPEPT